MSMLETLGYQAMAGVGGGLGEQLSYGLGEITGYNDALSKDQLEQQEKLNKLQSEQNKELYDYQFNKTTPAERVRLYKEAGLNPALIYGMGGGSGTTATMGSGGGSQAANSSQMRSNNIASMQMGLQMAKLQSEIDVNKSVAMANKANAEKATAETTTTNNVRETLIENMKQQGIETWLRNEISGWTMRNDGTNDVVLNNSAYNVIDYVFSKDSLKAKEITNAILKTYNEAVTSGQLGNAAEKNAETNRLALELQQQMTDYQTGKDIDWKNVGELLVRFLPLLLGKGGGGGITINNK